MQVLTAFVPRKELLFYIDFKSPDAVADTIEVVKRFGIEERIIMGAIPTDANLEVRVHQYRRADGCHKNDFQKLLQPAS